MVSNSPRIESPITFSMAQLSNIGDQFWGCRGAVMRRAESDRRQPLCGCRRHWNDRIDTQVTGRNWPNPEGRFRRVMLFRVGLHMPR